MSQRRNRTIGIIGAMDREVQTIKDSLKNVSVESLADADFVVGTYDGMRIVAVVSGIGLVNAACTTQCMIDRYNPDTIIFTGIGGSLNPIVGVDDIVIGKTLLYSDATRSAIAESAPYAETFESDDALIDYAVEALKRLGYVNLETVFKDNNCNVQSTWKARHGQHGYVIGKIASGNKFITSAEKDDVKSDTKADCAEMEGTAIAHVARRNSTITDPIKTVIIRSMSDTCGDEPFMTDEWQLDTTVTAENAARIALSIASEIASESSDTTDA